jgi:sugar phosphate isomerase/epimerase
MAVHFIMFTKHLEGKDIGGLIGALQSVGVEGADLCVRPNYPVTPENAPVELPKAARTFTKAGLNIPLVTTPTRYTDPKERTVEPLFAACAEAGVRFVKLGYWMMGEAGYWATVDKVRKDLEGFAAIARKTGVAAVVHTHSGETMGLNACSVMNLVKGFDPKCVGVFLDSGHLTITGEPIPIALSAVGEYLKVFAFKDVVRERVVRQKVEVQTEPVLIRDVHGGKASAGVTRTRVVDEGKPTWQMKVVPLGEGYVDWPGLLSRLRAIGFDGPVSIHSEYSGVPVDTVIDLTRIDVRYIRALLGS